MIINNLIFLEKKNIQNLLVRKCYFIKFFVVMLMFTVFGFSSFFSYI